MNNLENENRISILDNLKKFFYQDIRNNWLSLITPQWDDIVLGGRILGAGASAPDLIPFNGSNIYVYGFAGLATSEQLFGQPEILHSYKQETNIYVHVHWTPTDNNAGNVEWLLEYTWANVDTVFPAATLTSIIDPSSGIAWTHQLAEFPVISGAGKNIGSMFNFRLYRVPGGDDTYKSDAALLSIGIHYEINTFGSRQRFSK